MIKFDNKEENELTDILSANDSFIKPKSISKNIPKGKIDLKRLL